MAHPRRALTQRSSAIEWVESGRSGNYFARVPPCSFALHEHGGYVAWSMQVDAGRFRVGHEGTMDAAKASAVKACRRWRPARMGGRR